MRKRSKLNHFFILLTSVLLTVCIVGTSIATSEEKKESDEKGKKIVAKINDKSIYEDQLAPLVEKELRTFRKFGAREDSPDLVKRLQKKALDEVIGQEILYQESQKLDIPDIEEKIKEKMEAMKSRYQSEEHFEKSMKAKNLTKDDLRESIRRSIFVDEYLKKQGIRNPEVPEAEIKEFYEKNKGSFKREETVRVSHILVKIDESAKPEEKEQARKKAEKIRQEIEGGKDFAEMAKEHSACNSASKGGDLGYIKRGYMPPEFEKVAFALKKGELSDIVQTKFGYHLIKVVDKKTEGIAPYDEVKDFIGKYLQEGISQKKLASHITDLREKAKIEIFLN